MNIINRLTELRDIIKNTPRLQRKKLIGSIDNLIKEIKEIGKKESFLEPELCCYCEFFKDIDNIFEYDGVCQKSIYIQIIMIFVNCFENQKEIRLNKTLINFN